MIKAIVLDSETTGFRAPDVIEVAYLELKALEEYLNPSDILKKKNEYQSYFNTNKVIEAGAHLIHGLTKADLAGFSKFKFSALGVHESVEYIIGHNISYDYRVMGKPSGYRYICTLKLAKLLFPGLDSYKLNAVMKEFFPEMYTKLVEDYHSALVDCKLCVAIIAVAVSEFEINSYEELYGLAGYIPK